MSGPFVVLFVIIEDNRLHVIRTRSEFIQRFAPVTTEAEALAFAVALSEGRAEFDSLDYARESLQRPIAPVVRGTIVTPVADVFQVRLFDGDVFGCGAKMTYRFNATVTRRGAVRGSRAEALYQRQPGCVD